MSLKIKKCAVCGADIAKDAKQCPKCGAKNKQLIFTKWWFWLIAVVIVIAIANSGNPKKSPETSGKVSGNINNTEKEIVYTSYDVTDLFDVLNENALKAQNTYKGQYVELSGYLGTIDSNGKYMSLEANPDDYDYLFQSIHCTLKKDSNQLNQVMEMKKGDKIIVKGKISQVGEVLGYYLDVESIN